MVKSTHTRIKINIDNNEQLLTVTHRKAIANNLFAKNILIIQFTYVRVSLFHVIYTHTPIDHSILTKYFLSISKHRINKTARAAICKYAILCPSSLDSFSRV